MRRLMHFRSYHCCCCGAGRIKVTEKEDLGCWMVPQCEIRSASHGASGISLVIRICIWPWDCLISWCTRYGGHSGWDKSE
jgi:hypothetical protein